MGRSGAAQRVAGKGGWKVANGEKTAAIVGRMKEPSTWAGLTALLAVFGLSVPEATAISQVGAAITGALAVFMPEVGRK